MPLTSILPGFFLSHFITIQHPSSIPFTLHLAVASHHMNFNARQRFFTIWHRAWRENPREAHEIQQNERQRSQCNQTIVCDCELPVFAPARTSDALLRGSAVRDENAAAKHQAYTV